ncbi:hypothetical protein BDM02DRAFT_3106912 [Thelephora ganbajun]|uniref:Uncharacterized protein n=1 Tax=Thelephora ganbajun TaxID=370292 RepID=A0ACB6ZWY6_THEGA|nr:hypothetical protein BDM02DRAFT_3106912 [Thelephora ganbajun]
MDPRGPPRRKDVLQSGRWLQRNGNLAGILFKFIILFIRWVGSIEDVEELYQAA